jgi:hypothetical protein
MSGPGEPPYARQHEVHLVAGAILEMTRPTESELADIDQPMSVTLAPGTRLAHLETRRWGVESTSIDGADVHCRVLSGAHAGRLVKIALMSGRAIDVPARLAHDKGIQVRAAADAGDVLEPGR